VSSMLRPPISPLFPYTTLFRSLDPALGWPDLTRSRGVAGARTLPSGRYLALTGDDEVELILTDAPPSQPFLVAANAALIRWERRSEEHTSELQSQSNLVCRLLL